MRDSSKTIDFLQPLENPPSYVMEKEGNTLEITMDVQYADNIVFGAEKPNDVIAHTRVFMTDKTKNSGRTIPGPTIELRRGSHLIIHTTNKLPPLEETVHDINFPHGFNDYNLHTHGLHVSPQSPADNVCMTIKPGENFRYEYQIPSEHPCGAYWYHPHKHGSVAIQVGSGMAGMLLIRGPFDDELKSLGVKEHILVFQNIAANEKGEVEEQNQVARFPNSEYGITVNGQYIPVIHCKTGELLNLRMLNATTRSSINFACPFSPSFTFMDLMATQQTSIGLQEGVSLAPANRASVLMKVSEAATPGALYYVYNDSIEHQYIPHYKYHNNAPLFAIQIERGKEIGAAIYMPSEPNQITTPPPFPQSLHCGLLDPSPRMKSPTIVSSRYKPIR